MPEPADIARALREIAALQELQGESVFRVRAWENAAWAVEALSEEELQALVAEERLQEVRGIGRSTAMVIDELWRTGRSRRMEELRAHFPRGVLDMAQLPGVGPKRAIALREALGIESVEALEAACRARRVREVAGFGARSEERILEGIEQRKERAARMLLSTALELGEPFVEWLGRSKSVAQAALAGSARRYSETVGDLDVVVATADSKAAMDHAERWSRVRTVEQRGDTKLVLRLDTGTQVDVRTVVPGEYATALHHFTGSKRHHLRLRSLAREHGLSISEYGVVHVRGGRKVPVHSEADLYKTLGMQYVPPELREDEGEVEAALKHRLPRDLVQPDDVRGLVHCHSTWSDGQATLEEMARAADALGFEYMTVTDHSPSAHYAGGLTVDRLRRQWDEIARVQERVRVRLLRGTESDILQDGRLDYPDSVLEQLDVIIASIHNRHGQDEDRMTRRLLRMVQLPLFKIWGHAVGRLLLERAPISVRMEEVLDAAAGSAVAIEVNGQPERLDMEPRWLRAARERRIPFVLSVDAHSTQGLDRNLRLAAGVARRGWVRRSEVLNTLPADDFMQAVRPVGGDATLWRRPDRRQRELPLPDAPH